ncbi:hypothetical protein CKA32_001845 [Geitlerinema sp. FC II]|nr:hypothetical protein CKA32_001845 [Geitlerinema sp. FC II]
MNTLIFSISGKRSLIIKYKKTDIDIVLKKCKYVNEHNRTVLSNR